MKKLVVLLLIIFNLVLLSGCDMFSESGNIEDYMGEYLLTSATAKEYHIAYNNKKLKSEREIISEKYHILIQEDKKVIFTKTDGETSEGRIKCLKEYCRFYFSPFESSYKFYLRNDKSLYYSDETFHMSCEYDVTYTHITLTKVE